MVRLVLFLVVCLTVSSCTQEPEGLWSEIIRKPSKNFNQVFHHPDDFELQIVYTQIDTLDSGEISLTSHEYNYDPEHYFYPASTVKMPVAFLALQRLKELQGRTVGISKESSLKIFKNRDPQTKALQDTTSANGLASIGHYITKLFAVSDNDAYNRLYEFLGRDYINKNLRELGVFSNSRIVTRVGISGYTLEDNAYGNPMIFMEGDSIVYRKPESYSTGNYIRQLNNTLKGKGYFDDKSERVINEAFDMSEKNFINLKDLEGSLRRIIMPEIYDKKQQFNLSDENYSFLRKSLSVLPGELEYPAYDTSYYTDNYVKFFVVGDQKTPMPENLKIYNKVGYAYGTVTDCAFIENKEAGVSFFLTATLLVNENGIFNDGKYEYDDVAIPFLAELGRQVYDYELRRKKNTLPQ